MAKKVIRLTEADLQKLVQKVLSEQPMNDNLVLAELNDRIQSFIAEKQSEIFNESAFIRLVVEGNTPYVVITNKDREEVYKKAFNNQNIIPINGSFVIADERLSNYYDEIIGGNSNFETLISLHPEIKDQMDKMKISLGIVPLRGEGTPSFKFDIRRNSRQNRNQYKEEGIYGKYGEAFPIGDVFNNAKFVNRINRKVLGLVEMGAMQLALGRVGLVNFGDKGENVPNTGDTSSFAEGKVKLDLVDMFDYDTINFKDETKFNQALSVFNEKLNNGLTDLKGLKDWLEKQNLIVYGYASQDADPEESVQGKYGPCKGYGSGLRKEYNVCLSNARAEKVASELQKVFDDAGVQVTIKHQGAGETTKFSDGNGWSDKQKDTEEQLSPNRRVLFNIPKYTEVIRN